MNALDNRIKELVAYARSRDGEDRSTLYRNLIDLFLTGKAPKADHTRSQLLDVIEAMIPHVDSETRRTAADLLANMLLPPSDLALRLCRDRASIVANLIKLAPFDEDDIIELIGRTGREHHQILATREDLSANVWIALARAAPSAPPFDHQSTLALWSDDLGILRTAPKHSPRQDTATVTPLHPARLDQMHAETPHQAATNGIRIIKTGDDLIAERADTKPNAAQDNEKLPHTALKQPAPKETEPERKTVSKPSVNNAALQQFLTEDFATSPLKDPGPGGWSWQTDRDGIVMQLSPYGEKLLGETSVALGASVLDLLGLNAKLGHPVARAFQRRSTIHDAPIHLGMLDKPHQHWTLEATPLFSAHGGIFEGYEGILTPVVPASNDDSFLLNDDDGSAMFLDDLHGDDEDDAPIEKQPYFKRLDKEPLPSQERLNTPEESVSLTDDTTSLISATTATAVADIIKDAFGGLHTNNAPKEPQETAAPQPAESTPDTNVAAAPGIEQMLATLEVLDEALKRLTDAAKTSTNPGVRLQGDIATACARSLKEQLLSKQ